MAVELDDLKKRYVNYNRIGVEFEIHTVNYWPGEVGGFRIDEYRGIICP
jgi:hypothetical protein